MKAVPAQVLTAVRTGFGKNHRRFQDLAPCGVFKGDGLSAIGPSQRLLF